MNFNSRYHPRSFLPKIVLGKMFNALGNFPYREGELLVLNYHSTPQWLSGEFEKQVQFLFKRFTPVAPQYINEFFENRNSGLNKPAVIFTFDDGLKNNIIAARILEKYNARGLFFVVPAFLNEPATSQEQYYRKYIRTIVNTNIDTSREDVTAMTDDDIRILISNGHAIGSHSFSHTMNRDDDVIKSVNEIQKSREFLENRFHTTIENFCAPFNSLLSTNKDQMNLIRKHYRFFHSTFPGSNKISPDPFFIRRVNLECWWPADVINFALSGFEWKRWNDKREQFRNEVLK